MTDKDYDKLRQIEEAIQSFNSTILYESSLALFKALDYQSNKTVRINPTNFDGFLESFGLSKNSINLEKALSKDWKQVEFLFQFAEDDITHAQSLFDSQEVNRNEYQSFLFFAIQLEKESYKRGDLVKITREINLPFKMPVIVLFHYGTKLTLSIIDRRLHKRDISKDVLEKVTLIKDIDIVNPHRAHKEILKDLSLNELNKKFAFHSFIKMHEAWKATLNVSELNKKFFQELSNWYFWAMDKVKFPDDLEKKEDVRNATNLIRLITRVIFIWFIKEKSLVPDDLFNKEYLNKILKGFKQNDQSHNYYQAILQNLFFGTLNQKMDERKFAKEGEFVIHKEEYGVKNLFRYSQLFNLPENEVVDLFKNIPFLNGGLFDCLDKPNDEDKIVYVDGFSRNPKKQAQLPDYLFFSEEREVDLTQYYSPEAKKPILKKVKGLIDLLESYKFTIAENTPIEEEIALDPELLGKVFENLLASYNPETQTTARKQTGSFYTPREIVSYMVNESLIAYFQGKLESMSSFQLSDEEDRSKDASDTMEGKLRKLFLNSEETPVFSEKEKDVLIEAINHAKIVDPACGSGAFPMGILHQLVNILQKLDPDNTKWKAQQKEKVIGSQIKELEKDKIAIHGLSDQAVREKAEQAVADRLKEIEEIFENENYFDDYARKLYLIENCIYGIDIQPIAVQISKLRFFISLIIDQEKDANQENLGLRSLPNLETKFVAANTLIGLEIPTSDLFSASNPIKALQEELKAVRHAYFNANNRQEKLRLQKQDKRLRKQIAATINDLLVTKNDQEIVTLSNRIALEKNLLSALEKETEKIEIIKTTDLLGEVVITKTDRKKEKLKAQKALIVLLDKQLKKQQAADNKEAILKVAEQIATFDPYDQNHFANWFEPEWMFGITDGFDVVIGNPPYVQIQKLDKNKKEDLERQCYKTYERTGDIYQLFYEQGIKTLKGGGILCFITSSQWMKANYGRSLRNFFLLKNPIMLILLGPGVFESAIVDTNILILKNSQNKNQLSGAIITEIEKINSIDIQNIEPIPCLNEESWSISALSNQNINNKIKSKGKPINKWDIKINFGIKTGCNEAFIIDDEKRNKLINTDEKSVEIIKPILRGREIEKYFTEWDGMYLINTHNGLKRNSIPPVEITNYAAIKEHLEIFLDKITSRQDQGITPYNLRNCTYLKEFSKEKVIWKRIGSQLRFSYSDSEIYCLDSTCIATGEKIKYLTALLNSKLCNYYLSETAPRTGMGDLIISVQALEPFTVYYPTEKEQIQFEELFDDILQKKKSNQDTTILEHKIDELVFKLYELTYEEVQVVCPDFWLSEAEYETIKIE